MKFISENTVDTVVAQLEADPNLYELWMAKYSEDQEAIFVFYQAENFSLLTTDEYDLMIFMTLVILESCHVEATEVAEVSMNTLEEKEEANWAIFQESKSKTFRDKVTPFFDNTDQEDLLAFVEDSLVVEEDEEIITTVGREVLFLTLCTVVQCLGK
jgi:hypothetical protein